MANQHQRSACRIDLGTGLPQRIGGCEAVRLLDAVRRHEGPGKDFCCLSGAKLARMADLRDLRP